MTSYNVLYLWQCSLQWSSPPSGWAGQYRWSWAVWPVAGWRGQCSHHSLASSYLPPPAAAHSDWAAGSTCTLYAHHTNTLYG